ncbi:MAG: LVIVD repeat-containing protein, partial [Candidatus Flemingiibacterium sp.]
MSILNGAYAPETLMPEAQPFGDPFEATGEIKLDKTLDAGLLEAPDGNYLVSAGKNRLEIHRLDKSGIPVFVSALDGLGESRQISISNGFAYITARADGLYVCDLRDPVNPKLAARVDTLELATGVCAADGLLAVTNRHMGCELIDVRDPFHPKWLGSFYCGEAQSVWLYKNLALIGDWMNRRVRIFDITNPRAGAEISSFSVDGFADGVCVVETTDRLHPLGRTLCIAATGHHSAKLKNRRKYQNYSFVTAEMLAEGYGGGHGVEIFDITDPTDPEYVSSIKAPPHFGGIDTWRVFAAGNLCYFTDSMGGLFEIDITDIEHPRFTRRFRLPVKEKQRMTPPSLPLIWGDVTGIAIHGDHLCVAGDGGVYILDRRDGED